MKNIIKLAVIILFGASIASAQNTKQDKKKLKAADIVQKIAAQHYTFVADYVIPMHGGGHSLGSNDYDFRVRQDSLIAYLPYFGRAYFDVPYNPTDGGVKFTSTKFAYKLTAKKGGGWHVELHPKDVKYVNSLYLDISADGYASLSINSTNRDPINFNGYINQK